MMLLRGKGRDRKLSVEELATALYEGTSHLENLAEKLARQHGQAQALSFFQLMGDDVRNFWCGIAKQLIDHAREWQKNQGSGCCLSPRETARLAALPRVDVGQQPAEDRRGHPDVAVEVDQDDPAYVTFRKPRNPKPNFGSCCACGIEDGQGATIRNIIMLNKKSPIAGKGWGCVQCDLAPDGAIAVVCDECAESKRQLVWACRGWPGKDGRIPVEALEGEHEHDMSKHPEADDARG